MDGSRDDTNMPPPPIPVVDSTDSESNVSGIKRKRRSWVWNHATPLTVDGVEFGLCNYCKRKIKGGSLNGTTSIGDHVKKCMPTKSQDIRQMTLQAKKRKDGQMDVRNFCFDQDVSRKDLAHAIIMHEYPLSIVEHAGFRRFINGVQPLFKMVSRNTMKSDILKIYDVEKEKTRFMLDTNEGRIALTSDMWTSTCSNRGFMAITAHFINADWKLQSRLMRFVYVPGPHNKEVLSDVMFQSIFDWNLDRKLSTITMDNCRTNDSIVTELKKKFEANTLILEGDVFQMRCCAHILNLIVKDGLDVIKKGIDKIRASVHFWTGSPSRSEKFEEAARQLKISCTKKLCCDVPTRWNSTYFMLQSAIIYKDVFSRLFRQRSTKLYKEMPSEEDWHLAKIVCSKLKIFHQATDEFSASKHPTANNFFHKICDIKISIRKWLDSPVEVVSSMASKMLEKYEKYWSVIHLIMGVACVLDPRYKLAMVLYLYEGIYGVEAASKTDGIRAHCEALVSDYRRTMRLDESQEVQIPKQMLHDSDMSDEEESGRSLKGYYAFINSNVNHVEKKSELDEYLAEAVLPPTDNFDILNWWKAVGSKYPTLQRIARDIYAVPVSSVASECAFSTGGRVLTPHRNRLHPTTLEALMCTQSWLLNAVEDDSSACQSCVTVNDEEEDDDYGDDA